MSWFSRALHKVSNGEDFDAGADWAVMYLHQKLKAKTDHVYQTIGEKLYRLAMAESILIRIAKCKNTNRCSSCEKFVNDYLKEDL